LSGIVNKIKNFVGMVSGYEDEEEMFDDLYRTENNYPVEQNLAMDPHYQQEKNTNLKVVRHPGARSYEVMVIEPRTFEESLEIVDNLRQRKTVVLNLHLLDNEQSQRIVDFLSGATHAVDGNQQKIGEGVFIFTPNNVSISAETDRARSITDAFWNQHK
jgi:cell division inhibitor SepF